MRRCPSCANFLHFVLYDDLWDFPVYRCTTVGVARYVLDKQGKQHFDGTTLDHSDHYYRIDTLERVELVKIPQGKSAPLWTTKPYQKKVA